MIYTKDKYTRVLNASRQARRVVVIVRVECNGIENTIKDASRLRLKDNIEAKLLIKSPEPKLQACAETIEEPPE